MSRKPDFFILAGPNGAGKSTNGHLFVPISTHIFNGDQVLADLVKKYPTIEPTRLHGGVAKALEDARDAALASKQDFAFESNYSSDMATEITILFKNAGYRTTLIYFGLDSLKASAARVKERKVLGGHDVSFKTLQYNFEESVKRVNKDLDLFDNILFVDTRNQNTRIISLLQKEQNKRITLVENIGWYNKHFRQQVEALKTGTNQLTKEMQQKTPKRGKGFRR